MTDLVEFVESLEELSLPILLSTELQDEISGLNNPLPSAIVEAYLKPDYENWDEYTEMIPVGKISLESSLMVLFWKAHLLEYDFLLVGFSPNGSLVDRKRIAGTKVDESGHISETVASIEEDLLIFMAQSKDANKVQSSETTNKTLIIKETGEISQL